MFGKDTEIILLKGNFYHRLQLQDNVKPIFEKIMKLHTYQEDWFRLKAIYSDFYGDPTKDALKRYIKRLEVHIHNKLERKGLSDFRSGIAAALHKILIVCIIRKLRNRSQIQNKKGSDWSSSIADYK